MAIVIEEEKAGRTNQPPPSSFRQAFPAQASEVGRPKWREGEGGGAAVGVSAHPSFSTRGLSDLGQNGSPFLFLLRPLYPRLASPSPL